MRLIELNVFFVLFCGAWSRWVFHHFEYHWPLEIKCLFSSLFLAFLSKETGTSWLDSAEFLKRFLFDV